MFETLHQHPVTIRGDVILEFIRSQVWKEMYFNYSDDLEKNEALKRAIFTQW